MVEVRAFVFRYQKPCWKCSKPTPVLYAFRPPDNEKHLDFDPSWVGMAEVNPEHDQDMATALAHRFEWYGPGFSNTMGEQVYACWCTSCGVLQGNHYIWKDMLQKWYENPQPDEFIDYDSSYDADDH
tara:strand:- start:15 stop:395 length:381 start_codon:yes stop_codon:yes gene_type:complete